MVLAIRAPLNERSGNRQANPNTTAPHLYSTNPFMYYTFIDTAKALSNNHKVAKPAIPNEQYFSTIDL